MGETMAKYGYVSAENYAKHIKECEKDCKECRSEDRNQNNH